MLNLHSCDWNSWEGFMHKNHLPKKPKTLVKPSTTSHSTDNCPGTLWSTGTLLNSWLRLSDSQGQRQSGKIFLVSAATCGVTDPFLKARTTSHRIQGTEGFWNIYLACKIFVYMSILLPSCVQSRSRAVADCCENSNLQPQFCLPEERGWIQIDRTNYVGIISSVWRAHQQI